MDITINDLQAYLADRYCGWANEQGMFMKLVEEIGEVAEVLNKKAGRKATDETDLQEQLGIELADMIHYIVAIAALNGIDLNKTILEKDKVASIKYNHKINLETFIAEKKKGKPFDLPFWSYWPDLNRRPADYESAALPTEPQ